MGKAESKGRRDRRLRRIAERELGGFGSSPTAGIRPTGRAPRGQGGEYAARRRIADRLDSWTTRRDRAQTVLSQSRGQSRYRRRDSIARDTVQQLSRAISAGHTIANTPGDWQFKDQLIRDVAASLGL